MYQICLQRIPAEVVSRVRCISLQLLIHKLDLKRLHAAFYLKILPAEVAASCKLFYFTTLNKLKRIHAEVVLIV